AVSHTDVIFQRFDRLYHVPLSSFLVVVVSGLFSALYWLTTTGFQKWQFENRDSRVRGMAYYWETNGLGIKKISVFRGAFGMTLARIPHGGTSIFGISSVVAGFSPRSAPACGHGVPEANAG